MSTRRRVPAGTPPPPLPLFPFPQRGPLLPGADTRSRLCPRHGSGQEERIFCELVAWSLLIAISVPPCLVLRGRQASVILPARGSGLEMLRMREGSQSLRERLCH